ncbi:hypothetical protein UCRNP2_5765 [Neofusicoccum parvum UCRNP2]|uniref:Uncharacterized protein n=1 Tax=Botryosphaeria parva (strain UCR-NP2) TaxID=1287680 RepID=R1EJ30_BOTPV|nr:hypothetical protein UCRNP2_5765 [Neofusicoccum parvum UCRNP2]
MSTKGYKVIRREKPFKEDGKLRVWVLLEKDTSKDENVVSDQASSATQASPKPVDKPTVTPPSTKAGTAAPQPKPAVNSKQTATPDNSRPTTPANTAATASTKQSGPAAAANKPSPRAPLTKPAASRKPQPSALRPSTAGSRKRTAAINRPRPSSSSPAPSPSRKRRASSPPPSPAPASKKPARGTVIGREPYRDGAGRLINSNTNYKRREGPRGWAELARAEAVALAEHGGVVKTPFSGPFGKK